MDADTTAHVRQHLRIGWWTLLLFLCLGITLEAMHGFKVAWYLNVGMETRRLMWRLAHAHGTFLSLVHIAYAATIFLWANLPSGQAGKSGRPAQAKREKAAQQATPWYIWPSRLLIGASVALPGGFFLGGVVIRGGDPGLGVLLLPIGAAMLLLAVFTVARAVTRVAAG